MRSTALCVQNTNKHLWPFQCMRTKHTRVDYCNLIWKSFTTSSTSLPLIKQLQSTTPRYCKKRNPLKRLAIILLRTRFLTHVKVQTYDESAFNSVFIEGVNASICRRLRGYWAYRPQAGLSEITFRLVSLLAIQKRSCRTPANGKSNNSSKLFK